MQFGSNHYQCLNYKQQEEACVVYHRAAFEKLGY